MSGLKSPAFSIPAFSPGLDPSGIIYEDEEEFNPRSSITNMGEEAKVHPKVTNKKEEFKKTLGTVRKFDPVITKQATIVKKPEPSAKKFNLSEV